MRSKSWVGPPLASSYRDSAVRLSYEQRQRKRAGRTHGGGYGLRPLLESVLTAIVGLTLGDRSVLGVLLQELDTGLFHDQKVRPFESLPAGPMDIQNPISAADEVRECFGSCAALYRLWASE